MKFEKIILSFLKTHRQTDKPFLVGFSGGSDSLALVHCLHKNKIHFHIAHFDHGWRKKSQSECEKLQKWAENQGIVFLSSSSKTKIPKEGLAREERFAFFLQLFAKGQYEALVLAHQKEDHAETVLKQIFEGAPLNSLQGIRQISYRDKMPIWRPMLTIEKKEVLAYLERENLTPIDDQTNRDPKYLRARMRSFIMPLLRDHFGKEITPSLVRFAKRAGDWDDYLYQQIEKFIPIEGPFGKMWDLSLAHSVEIEAILKQNFSLTLTRKHQLIDAVLSKRANYEVSYHNGKMIVDRQKLFWLTNELPQFTENFPLDTKVIRKGGWEWRIDIQKETHQSISGQTPISHQIAEQIASMSPQVGLQKGGDSVHATRTHPAGDQDVVTGCASCLRGDEKWGLSSWWKGKFALTIPTGYYMLSAPDQAFRKDWNKDKIPAFLRNCLPILKREGKPTYHFFTRHSKSDLEGSLLVTVEIIPIKARP